MSSCIVFSVGEPYNAAIPIQKWEYKYERLVAEFNAYSFGKRSPGEDKLDALGAQGWEP